MKQYESLKIVMVGAGSCSFCPKTLQDILLSDLINTLPLEVCLMDIDAHALEVGLAFAQKAIDLSGRNLILKATTDLDEALVRADFVITAIEVDRYHYWSMDFHIPRRYGFRQVYGENGGPGGMFHTLRNLGPILHIARRMELLCPDAWLINYTNPEAKLVEAVCKLTSIRAVGVCHGFDAGVRQIAAILDRDAKSLSVTGYGLNHFGWITKIQDQVTGEDLYPAFREKEAQSHLLSSWDNVGLCRMMFRIYGLYPYPGTNHVGEYIAWSDAFLASSQIQYFFDPVRDHPWETKRTPRFVYDFTSNPTAIAFSDQDPDKEQEYLKNFSIGEKGLTRSAEYGIPIIEAIVFDLKRHIPSLNLLNKGQIPGIMHDMCVEGPCVVDGNGIHPIPVEPLPAAVTAMINQQGTIHRLVIEAYEEKSKNKLLQAMLLDPTISSYQNAVALIDEICDKQKDILPELHW